MPYISPKDREELKKQLSDLITRIESLQNEGVSNGLSPKEDGLVNYCFSKILLSVYHERPSYYNYNRMMGVLECVKQELYRRVIVPYEEKKISENGDIIENGRKRKKASKR